jgi:Domain of unknown function (DUF1937)
MSYAFLASPYSHPDYAVMEQRYKSALYAVEWFYRHDQTVFSPIVHCHELAKLYSLPSDAKFWWKHNRAMLISAAQLFILTIDGWDTSAGIQREVGLATVLNHPIKFIVPPLYEEKDNLP